MDCIFIPLSSLDATLPLLATPLILPEHLNSAVAKRQRDYLAGRACAQFLYGRYRLPWDGLPMYPDTHPLWGAPQWPEGFVGSISHSKDLAVACMHPRHRLRGVGLDTEHIMDAGRAQQLRDQILHPRESWVKTPLELTLVFSFKESIYKALNPLLQRFIGFQEVIVHPPDERYTPLPQSPVGKSLSLSWQAEPPLAKEINTYFGCSRPPALQGHAQWWANSRNTTATEPAGFVLTHYSL